MEEKQKIKQSLTVAQDATDFKRATVGSAVRKPRGHDLDGRHGHESHEEMEKRSAASESVLLSAVTEDSPVRASAVARAHGSVHAHSVARSSLNPTAMEFRMNPTPVSVATCKKSLPLSSEPCGIQKPSMFEFFTKSGSTLPVPKATDKDHCAMFRANGKCPYGYLCHQRHYDFRFGIDMPTQYVFRSLQSQHVDASGNGSVLPTSPSPAAALGVATDLSAVAMLRPMEEMSKSAPPRDSTDWSHHSLAERTHWKTLIAGTPLATQKWPPATQCVTKERIRELLDAQFDICWDYNSAEGCTRASGRCRWRHHKLVLAVAGAGDAYTLTVDHPTRVGFNVEVIVRPSVRSTDAMAFL